MCIQSKTLLNIYWNGYWIQMDKYRKLLHRKRSIIFATTTTTWWRSYASVTIQVSSRIFLTAVSLVGSRGGCWSLSQLHTGEGRVRPFGSICGNSALLIVPRQYSEDVLAPPLLPAHLRTVPVRWGETQLLLPKIPAMLIPGLSSGGPWKLILSSGTLCASPIDLFTRSNKDN